MKGTFYAIGVVGGVDTAGVRLRLTNAANGETTTITFDPAEAAAIAQDLAEFARKAADRDAAGGGDG